MPRKRLHGRVLLPATLLILATLACGGFQLRSEVTPSPTRSGTPKAVVKAASPTPTAAATEELAPTATPTATPAPTVVGPGGVTVGKPARVVAVGGVNVRDKAGRTGKQVGKLDNNATVSVQEGPVNADNYLWWKIDNGAGLIGWVAGGPQNDPWLVAAAAAAPVTPATGGGRLVDRPVKIGDVVQVTTQEGKVLTVRENPGLDQKDMARVMNGKQFTVTAGPEQRDNLTWWQLQAADVSGWGAEGDGTDRWLTPVER